ncbi:MAG TPA: penicillin-binding protein [Bacteroidales bacterium]|nr:penicillin-binding protein [Bacteroidales bacterium]
MKEVKKDILWRVYLIYIFVLLFSFVIVGQVIKIQFVEGDSWERISKMQTIDTMKVEAVRGNICADDGSLLATSVPIFDIYWDSQVPTDKVIEEKIDSLSYFLSKFFQDKTKSEYKKLLLLARKSKKEYLLIHKSFYSDERTQVDMEDLKTIKSFPIFKLGKNKGGLIVEQKEKRIMPYQLLAKRTIGYNREGVFVGLEGSYSKTLEGISGIRLRKKIANGVWVPMNENEIEPQNGSDVITTIDKVIQDVAENSLLKNLIKNNADHGCVVLMEVETGHVKAIANLTRVSDEVYDEKYNYAIGESSEPGSTFKLFSIVAALDDGVIDLEDKVAIGKIKYYDREMKDSHIKGYGPETIRQAFEESSNVGISQAIYNAYKNNPQKFTDKLYSMRVNKTVGLDIEGEQEPVVKNPKMKSWSKVTLPWMSIGYEVALTPIQILTFYNAIANNGKMMKPQFVKEVKRLGKTENVFQPSVLQDSICSLSTAKQARSLLEGVIESGTGKSLKNSIYKIAGKTGTAQVAKNSKGYTNEGEVNYKASFVGYFPADNPKYSCIVVVNNPSKGAYYGGAVAAPVFKDIADKIYSTHIDIVQQNLGADSIISTPFVKAANQKDLYEIYKGLDMNMLSESPEAGWVNVVSTNNNIILKERKIIYGKMPNVIGMGIKDGVYLLENLGLKVKIIGKGKIVSQSITENAAIKKGNTVILKLSNSDTDDAFALTAVTTEDSIAMKEDKKESEKMVDSKTNIKKEDTKKSSKSSSKTNTKPSVQSKSKKK